MPRRRPDYESREARLTPAQQAVVDARIAFHARRVALEMQALADALARARERAKTLTAPHRVNGVKRLTGRAFEGG